ncbi:MAG: hypothetical protein K8S15_06310 [Candidatus Aegiribacteria sp.]|nr:hypothetical protein [Candidatus Aegiribacteria sp.]
MKFGIIPTLLFVAALFNTATADVCFKNPVTNGTATVISDTGNSVIIEFNLETLESEQVFDASYGTGTVFRIPGSGLTANIGYPDLPAVRRMIEVSNYGEVEVEILDSETIALVSCSIPPFQPLQIRGLPALPFRINHEFYSGFTPWPATPVRLESVNILRDIRIAWVSFLPVSWNPSTGEVTVTTRVTARISTTGSTGSNELTRSAAGITRSFLPFYDEVLGFSEHRRVIDGSYVVISSEEGIDLMQDLIDWKTRKGFLVETAVIPGIGSTPAEIDTWIENAYNTWPNPPEYILLVGDEDVVPSPQYAGHSADNIYGVIGTGCVPSIHIGRLSGNNTDDLVYEAWKITEHEMYPYEPTQSWFNKGISIGHTEFTENSWDYVEYMMAAGLDITWFCANGGITPTIATLTDSINSGCSILGLCGHGDITHIYPPGFGNSDVTGLSNGRKLPWLALVACQVGMFDGHYCLCEAFMGEGEIADPKGAIGVMGPTTNSPYGAADSLVKWIFKGYFQEDIRHMGAVTDWSKNEVFAYFGSSAIDNNHMHMVFGCPEMDIYYDTSPLTIINCEHPMPVVPGIHTFTVTTDGLSAEGILVAVYVDDSSSGLWMESDYSDASGNVIFDIPTFSEALDIYVTATGFNLAPYLYSGLTGVEENPAAAVCNSALQADPSPCFGSLAITCTAPAGKQSSIEIYDTAGRMIRRLDIETSGVEQDLTWDGQDESGHHVSSGIYYCRLRVPGQNLVQSIVMIER